MPLVSHNTDQHCPRNLCWRGQWRNTKGQGSNIATPEGSGLGDGWDPKLVANPWQMTAWSAWRPKGVLREVDEAKTHTGLALGCWLICFTFFKLYLVLPIVYLIGLWRLLQCSLQLCVGKSFSESYCIAAFPIETSSWNRWKMAWN